jgi:uncharacterized protein (TIGR02453 family)
MAPSKKAASRPVSLHPAPAYFSEEAIRFLRSLKRNNRREWFQPRKDTFERELRAPMLALIHEVTRAMESFTPGHVRPAEKTLMRIYRDTRFSSDKRPYKQHLGAWWSRSGLEKTSGGGYYIHIGPDEFVVAAGVYMPQRDQLLAIRRHLLGHHQEARRLLHSNKLKGKLECFEGLPLTRAPKGFPADHPAMDLVLCRQWGVSAHLPVEAALQPTLAREVIGRFRLAAPLVDLLNAPLIAALAPRKKPIFGLF